MAVSNTQVMDVSKLTVYFKKLYVAPQRGMHVIKFKGGGEVPNALKSSYTAKHLAEQALSNYILAKHETPKKKKRARTKANKTI